MFVVEADSSCVVT